VTRGPKSMKLYERAGDLITGKTHLLDAVRNFTPSESSLFSVIGKWMGTSGMLTETSILTLTWKQEPCFLDMPCRSGLPVREIRLNLAISKPYLAL
jgi:hypothetical protein